jgi:hypothetical protein
LFWREGACPIPVRDTRFHLHSKDLDNCSWRFALIAATLNKR